MKKLAIMILTFLLCVSCVLFAACGSNDSNESEAQADRLNGDSNIAAVDGEAGESYGVYDAAEEIREVADSALGYVDEDYDYKGSLEAEVAPAPAAAESPMPMAEAAEETAAAVLYDIANDDDVIAINNRIMPQPGQLTAGEWSDIKNYDYYLNLLRIRSDNTPDIPKNQQRKGLSEYVGYFGFETRYMFTVSVIGAVNDARVELYDSNQNKLCAARTDIRGNAYLFPPRDLTGETITVTVNSGGFESSQSFVYSEPHIEITLAIHGNIRPILDIMFVVDTTGSMGDELEYLKQEIGDVISSVSNANENLPINLALLFYRDNGDEYVTKYFDFTTDITSQQQNLSRQRTNGGGDFPEAADQALAESVGQNWSGGGATRLIFHVCDAPPHGTQDSITRYFKAITEAAEKGIRIIPVASSGIDKATEYLLRQEALISGGTYIFLTNESGIGGGHIDPTIGEYTVEYLNACMVRVINEYLTGIEKEAVPFSN